ncbi:MAG: hypothetical protein LAT55_12200 [Opitutales bacterium]|nr:hypothetical protein [Opitutales bacterium]
MRFRVSGFFWKSGTRIFKSSNVQILESSNHIIPGIIYRIPNFIFLPKPVFKTMKESYQKPSVSQISFDQATSVVMMSPVGGGAITPPPPPPPPTIE